MKRVKVTEGVLIKKEKEKLVKQAQVILSALLTLLFWPYYTHTLSHKIFEVI